VIDVLNEHNKRKYYTIFMDNIYITSNYNEEWGKYIRVIMNTLWLNYIKLKEINYTFKRQETEFIGYKVMRIVTWMLE
jgi:hypothetical protein